MRHAETRNTRDSFSCTVSLTVQIFLPVLFVRKGLPNQMPSVGGGIDQDIVRLLFQSALDDRLQIFIFDLKFFKAQIIHVNDEFVIPVFNLGNHIVQILELVLVHLDNTQPAVIIFVDNAP